MMFLKRMVRLILVCLVLLLSGVSARTAQAGTAVDPSTLNPPPPDFFNPVCYATGAGVICDITFSQTEGPDESGLMCGTVNLTIMDVRTVQGHRYYDQNRNLLRRQFREVMVGTLSNPNTGAYLNYTQADIVIHDLAVPGDPDTGTEHVSGNVTFSKPNGATVLVGAGTYLYLDPYGEVLFQGGKDPMARYFEQGDPAYIQPLCDALVK